MADDNQQEYQKEANEAEMIAEGGAVQESSNPEPPEAESAEGADDSEEDSQGSGASPESADASEAADSADGGDGDNGVTSESAEPGPVRNEEDETPEGQPDTEVETQPVQEVDAEAALSAEPDAAADADYKRRLREYTRELKKQPGQWYIIQSYSGYENKVKTNLDMRIQTLEVEDSIYDVVVPIEQVVELKDGKRKIVKRKLLPGYVLVRMDINDAAWSVVRETPGVTSFVGNEGNATPVKHRDVAKFLMPKEPQVEGEAAKTEANAEGETVVAMPEQEDKPKISHDFQVGEAVTILSGALASVSATINEIDPETGKIQALVSIFGRETPVELTADQIERIM